MTEQTDGPGQVLRAEREALGVTTRDVAETLNLSITMVEAIEADDYERMPAAVFARGYIRAYARLLDLDPEPIVARYPEVAVSNELPERVEPPGIEERLRRHPQLVVGGLVLLALLLVVLIGVWLWPSDETEQAASGPAGGAAGEQAPLAETPGTPTAEASEAPAQREEIQEGSPADAAAPQLLAAVTAPEPVQVAAAEGGGARRITESGDDELRFAFTEDCWVEVRNATGRNLYSDLSRAGSSLALVGGGPFRILLGYAPGVTVTFNGEQVPLAPHTRNNVASLVLGQ